MDFPSSPPSMPEEVFSDLPSSPPLSPPSFPTRKRYADCESSLSSDPIFSEDASEEAQLPGPKRKRYRKGPWWRTPAVAREVGEVASKQKDSGVWLSSDSSDGSVGMGKMQSLTFDQFVHKRAATKSRLSMTKPSGVSKNVQPPTPDEVAAKLVFDAVDACQQSIDLSDMCLRHISNETLRPLHQLIRLPFAIQNTQKVTPEQYAPMTPEIKLFLSKNELESLPSELWNLGNITVLSVRNNQLTELSPWIARLRNLQELNIAGNQIRYLPWEMLPLMQASRRKLIRLSLGPNPFAQPLGKPLSAMFCQTRVPASAREIARAIRQLRSRYPMALETAPSQEALLLRLLIGRLREALATADMHRSLADTQSVYVASSEPELFEFDGSKRRLVNSTVTIDSQDRDSIVSMTEPVVVNSTSAAPSLFELCARSCARSPFINQLHGLLPNDASPPVLNALATAIKSKEEGCRKCSVCDKEYLIARARWVEYWHNGSGTGEFLLPFRRHACSWACVRDLSRARAQDGDACERWMETDEHAIMQDAVNNHEW